jgi:hypothetical protein
MSVFEIPRPKTSPDVATMMTEATTYTQTNTVEGVFIIMMLPGGTAEVWRAYNGQDCTRLIGELEVAKQRCVHDMIG